MEAIAEFFRSIIRFFLGLFGKAELVAESVPITDLMNPDNWIIGPITSDGKNYSVNMPLHPSHEDGWSFYFPLAPGEVDYVTAPIYTPVVGKALRIEFELKGDATIIPSETGGEPRLRLHMQRQGDDWSGQNGYEQYRVWSKDYIVLKPGTHWLEVPLTNENWICVYGDAKEVPAVMAECANIGFTFGGQFAGHGNYINQGSMKFILKNFQIIQ